MRKSGPGSATRRASMWVRRRCSPTTRKVPIQDCLTLSQVRGWAGGVGCIGAACRRCARRRVRRPWRNARGHSDEMIAEHQLFRDARGPKGRLAGEQRRARRSRRLDRADRRCIGQRAAASAERILEQREMRHARVCPEPQSLDRECLRYRQLGEELGNSMESRGGSVAVPDH